MKTIIFFAILFCVITLPAFGALIDADLDKIRLIVNDSEKRIKADLKAEIADVKKELKADIADVKAELKTEIAGVKKDLGEDIAKSETHLRDRITFLANLVYALIALIVAAIAIPQLIMTWRSGSNRALERQVEMLTQEVETLKQQRIVNP